MKRVCAKFSKFEWLNAFYKDIHAFISALTIHVNKFSTFYKVRPHLRDERILCQRKCLLMQHMLRKPELLLLKEIKLMNLTLKV